jgi:hypothetical protein
MASARKGGKSSQTQFIVFGVPTPSPQGTPVKN